MNNLQALRQRAGMRRILASRIDANRPLAVTGVLKSEVAHSPMWASLPAFPFQAELDAAQIKVINDV